MSKNHVLVLMSTYNGARYLTDQLDSIRTQRGLNVTLIVRDDKSKDFTLELLHTYKEKNPGFDLRILNSSENLGFARSFTELLRVASVESNLFDYYAFADQDDVWLPDKLFVAVNKLLLETDEKIPVSYCSNTTLVRSDLSVMGQKWSLKDVLISRDTAVVQSFAFGCTQVFNKTALELYLRHDETTIKRHDFLIYQISVFMGKVIYDPDSYIYYRQHENNQIGSANIAKRWKKRLAHFGHLGDHMLENQSINFLISYKDILAIEDVYRFIKVAYYRSDFFLRLSLLFDKKIRFQKFGANFFFKLKVILGGV